MFGFVMADLKDLSKEDQKRYSSVYCGICRQIRLRSSKLCRLALSFDMAFLSLLLMSLYEPEETAGKRACGFHPIKPRQWIDNEYIQYSADMNVALAYFNALDDYEDDRKMKAKLLCRLFGKHHPNIEARYPRQCAAIRSCIEELSGLEKENCDNPDLPASCFGRLMGELLVYQEDMWAPYLRQMGLSLGRFIYLADGAVDYQKDKKKHRYNPFLAMGMEESWQRWEQYLVLDMARCTESYEKLPLVQDKAILDNILYGGVWLQLRGRQPKEDKHD